MNSRGFALWSMYIRRLLGVWEKERSLDPKDQMRARGFTYADPLGSPRIPSDLRGTGPKRTPIEDFAPRRSRIRAWCSFLNRQTPPYRSR